MWLIQQFDSFLNLGTCKEYPIMAKAKTPRTPKQPITPVETNVTAMPETKVTKAPEIRTAAEPKKISPPTPINVEEEIRRRAYELSEQRGFMPGHDVDDWFIAEQEVMARYRQASA
jgi:hypothetical protein